MPCTVAVNRPSVDVRSTRCSACASSSGDDTTCGNCIESAWPGVHLGTPAMTPTLLCSTCPERWSSKLDAADWEGGHACMDAVAPSGGAGGSDETFLCSNDIGRITWAVTPPLASSLLLSV